MRRLLLITLALALPASASAQSLRRPARVEAHALFGEGTLLADGWGTVLVEVENLTRNDQRGQLELSIDSYRGQAMRRRVPLDVPAGQTRRALLTVFTGGSGNTVSVRYEEGGRVLARASLSVDYSPAEHSVVVFSDPPRLRGALLDLDVEQYGPGGSRALRYPVGTVRFDPATADPLLPESAAAWSTVGLLVASAPALARVSAPQRAAIEGWLRSGGELLVFPRSDADLRQPWLTSLVGEIATDGEPAAPGLWVPEAGPRFALRCTGTQRTEATGCARSFGLGAVHVAAYDGESSVAIESGRPRALVSALLVSNQVQRPALHFARGTDDLDQRYYSEQGTFGSLRAALDPNQGFRPALILVAFALMFYVVLVGPLNFRWVGKLNRPILALVTTPLAASACVLVLLSVGYVGKGVTMRYRRVEVVEALEGEASGFGRRYTGLFSTRPGTFALPLDDARTLTRRIGGGSGDGPIHTQDGGHERLVDFRAGLWETTFVREDRLLELGGGVRFERDGQLLTAVVNDSTEALEGAIVVDTSGAVYVVGDVAPGTRMPIPRTARGSLNGTMMLGPESDAPRTLVSLMGGEDDSDERARARGVMHLIGQDFVPRRAPVLYARLTAPRERVGGVFTPEVDQRWLRVQPRDEVPELRSPPEPEPDYDYDVDRFDEPEPVVTDAPDLEPDVEPTPEAAADGGAP
ncbi:MAG: hypothetical protein H6719_21000 [Sandaracinaceae bacterium]|nr:hypothetical protein [Sandaracinaceae bacterium]